MNSLQIDRILRAYRPLKGIFRGVFASNEMPPADGRRPFCFVANTMRAGTVGEHWVACYCESADLLEYFDSMADPEPVEDIQRYFGYFRHVRKSPMALQSLLSNACGLYCIYFLVKRRKSSFQKIIHGLHQMKMGERERYVKRYVQTLAMDNNI